MSDKLFSIILPVYDDQENLNRILEEFKASNPDDSWEIVVVDDGSPTALELPTNVPENWSIHRHVTREGAARARNTGANLARGENLIFLSVFLRIPENYIYQMRTFVQSRTFDTAQHLLVKTPGAQIDHFQSFLVDHTERLNNDAYLSIKNTQFAAAVIKRDTFLSVDGFDEGMNHYGGHELDLAYRLQKQGYSRRIVISDLSLERVNIETHDKVRSRLQEYGNVGLPALLKKHPELKKTILVYPAIWWLLKVLGVSKAFEKRYKERIEQNVKLPTRQYRQYLHLIVRNTWDAR